jgi:site-specific DNA recombinase
VSLEERTEQFGLSSQLTELRNFANTSNYKVVHELVDDGYSGADLLRPALTTLRDLVRSKRISAVLVHDPDRLARKLAHQLVLTEECERAGVRLEFVTAPNTDSMEGRLMLNVRGVIAEYEREKIRERTMRGRREKARQGLIVGGRRPYGYQVIKRPLPSAGTCTVIEEEAAVVVQIFQWLVEERLSIRQIVERLNQRGYPPHTSPRWATSTISRILRNEMYIGQAYYNRRQRVEPPHGHVGYRRNRKTLNRWRPDTEWISQRVPAIVPADLFQAARLQLLQNSAHCSGRPSKNIYLLRGVLRCARCGRKYGGTPIFGDRYYRCTGRQRLADPRCTAPVIAAGTLESFVWDFVVRLLTNPDLLEQKLADQGTGGEALEKELKHLQPRIRDIQRKEARLLEVMLDGEIGLPGLRQKAKELECQRLELERSYEQLETQIATRRDRTRLHETVLRYCKLLGSSVRNLDLVARQKLLRALVDEVTLDGNQISLKGILPMPPVSENRPQRQNVMIAGRSYFQGALGHSLAAHIAEIRKFGIVGG